MSITIDNLTQDRVTIKKQNYTAVDGVEYAISLINAKAYENTTNGRTDVHAEITEPYLSAILAMWEATPTVT